MKNESEKELSIRIHYDWMNKCRTCRFWDGNRADILFRSKCNQEKSHLFEKETGTETYCDQWDSYDLDTALEVLNGDWNHIHGKIN